MAVSGGYAYVAADNAGLRVIDVSTPAVPVEVGSVSTPGFALGVAVSGDYAYVAARGAGLRVIDVSAPVGSRRGRFRRYPRVLREALLSPAATPTWRMKRLA